MYPSRLTRRDSLAHQKSWGRIGAVAGALREAEIDLGCGKAPLRCVGVMCTCVYTENRSGKFS